MTEQSGKQSDRIRTLNRLALTEAARQGQMKLVTFPAIASIGLTLKCNLSCIMCFTRDMPKIDMDPVYLGKLDIIFGYLEEVRWNDAGELFASSMTKKYLDFINSHHVPLSSVSTSFTLVHRFWEEIFAGGITDLSISIDGSTKNTYESIRKGASFDRVMDNLKTFRAQKEKRGSFIPRLTFVFIAMKRNIHELPDYVTMAHDAGAETIHVLRLLPGPAHVELTEQVDPQTEKKYYAKALQKANQYGITLKHVVLENKEFAGVEESDNPIIEQLCKIPVQAFVRPLSGYSKSMPYCMAPWQEVVIGVGGEIRPCCFMDREMGHLEHQSFAEIWNGEPYQELRSKLYNGDYCYCRDCPWVKKYFAYYRPPVSRKKPPWEHWLKRMEQYAGLDHDCCTLKYGRFPRENDPLHFTINQQWQITDAWDQFPDTAKPDGNKMLAELLQKQQQFNASVVQYLNMLSDRFNTILTRQIHFNQESLINANMMSTRIDQANQDINGLLNILYRQVAGETPDMPLELETAFYSVVYELKNPPQSCAPDTEILFDLKIVNTSLTPWKSDDRTGAVQISLIWTDHENIPLEELETVKNIEKDLEPRSEIIVPLTVTTPPEKGTYTLTIDLVCTGIARFSQCGVPPLKISVVIT